MGQQVSEKQKSCFYCDHCRGDLRCIKARARRIDTDGLFVKPPDWCPLKKEATYGKE